MPILITKADGSQENFNEHKLQRSLKRAGADESEINHILKEVKFTLYDGIQTQEIYRHAFSLLRETETVAATRYSLRRALFGLGPTGFPFESFLARLFQTEGYTTKVGMTLNGKCAPHEIDVAAYKEDHSFVAEAKFHSRPGIKSDLQVAMYCYARLLDLKETKICREDICGVKEFLLVTNTKFTTTAESYADCVGLNLLSWNLPKNLNLHDRIQKSGLYPISVLQTLSTSQVATLIERGAIVCRDIIQNPQILRHLHISTRKNESIINEARAVCTPK